MIHIFAALRGKFFLLLGLLAILTGCASPTAVVPGPLFTRTPFPTPTSTATDVPLTFGIPVSAETPTGQPTGSTIPTATPAPFLNLGPTLTVQASLPSATPFPTLAPEPSRTPMPTGRIGFYNIGLLPTNEGLWAMRSTGTNMTLLTNDPILYLSVSPGGTMVAYITHAEPIQPAAADPFGYTLKLLTLNDDRTYTISSIDNAVQNGNVTNGVLDNAVQTITAYASGGLAWSPDGRSLAFISGQGGKSADIYLYTPTAAKIDRLTNLETLVGPPNGDTSSPFAAHAYGINWSLDGQRLYFAAAYQFGQNGSGNQMAGAWTVSRDGQRTVQVAGQEYSGEDILAWVGSNNLLLASTREDCGDQNLRTINLTSGKVNVLWPGCYSALLYDRYRQEILLSVTPPLANAGQGINSGLYFGSISQGLKQLSDHGFEKLMNWDTYGIPWYGFNSDEGLFSINRRGQINPIFTGPDYALTPNRLRPVFRWPSVTTWLFTADDGLYLARAGQPPAQLFNQPVKNLSLSPTRDRLYFFADPGDGSSQLYAVKATDLQPAIVDNRIKSGSGIIWP